MKKDDNCKNIKKVNEGNHQDIGLRKLFEWVDSYDIVKHYLRPYFAGNAVLDGSVLEAPNIGDITVRQMRNKKNIYRIFTNESKVFYNAVELVGKLFGLDDSQAIQRIVSDIVPGLHPKKNCIVLDQFTTVKHTIIDKKQPKFSFFNAPITNTKPTQSISISEMILLLKYKRNEQRVTQIRNSKDKKTRNIIKRTRFRLPDFK